MGLIVAAALTTAIALGGLAVLLLNARNRRPLALAFVIALPLQPLVFYAVRLPVDGALKTTFGFTGWIAILSLFYAPLTEEPAKWLAAAVPAVRRALPEEPVLLALAAGLGFAIGEIWFLAHIFATAPDYPDMPPWAFGGFVLERLEVCFLHGVFVSLPFAQRARGRSFWLGGLAGMALHFLLNFPIFLARRDVFGLGTAWPAVLTLWTLAFVGAGAALVFHLNRLANAASDR